MTAQEQGFLEAICADPHDVAVRLIYADWLEEHGENERAEFIRVECELEDLGMVLAAKQNRPGGAGRKGRSSDWDRYHALHSRKVELLNGGSKSLNNSLAWRWYVHPDLVCEFRRGFVEIVSCTCADWLKHGPAIVRAQPVLEVKLTNRNPVRRNYANVDSVRAEYSGKPFWAWHLEEQNTFADDFLPWAIYQELPDSIAGAWKHYASEASAWQALSTACITWARGPHPALGLEALPPL